MSEGGYDRLVYANRRRSSVCCSIRLQTCIAAILFEPDAALEIDLAGSDPGFANTTLSGLMMGANRLLVGGEVLQFTLAEPVAPLRWRLAGLLRGRAGTESAARTGHGQGARAVLLDEAITALDPLAVPAGSSSLIAAIGMGDDAPVYANMANPGLGRRPPAPVHPRGAPAADGSLVLGWTRRARGAWAWPDQVDAPLVEENEQYRIGLGPAETPLSEWVVSSPSLTIPPAVRAALVAEHAGAPLWVRQIGRFAQSDPLFLALLA